MALFSSDKVGVSPNNDLWKPEVSREGEDRILRFNLDAYATLPSLENDPNTMHNTINALRSEKGATKIIFFQKRDYEYDTTQTRMLVEIAELVDYLERHKEKLSLFKAGLDPRFRSWYLQKSKDLNTVVFYQVLRDPIGSYVQLTRMLREERIFKEGLLTADPPKM